MFDIFCEMLTASPLLLEPFFDVKLLLVQGCRRLQLFQENSFPLSFGGLRGFYLSRLRFVVLVHAIALYHNTLLHGEGRENDIECKHKRWRYDRCQGIGNQLSSA